MRLTRTSFQPFLKDLLQWYLSPNAAGFFFCDASFRLRYKPPAQISIMPRLFQQAFSAFPKKISGRRPIDDAVISRQRQAHHRSCEDLVAADNRAFFRGRDSQARHLRRIDDRGVFADAERTEIADGECAARHFILLEPSGAGAIDQIDTALADFLQAHQVDTSHDRDDQSIRDGDRHAEVHVAKAG